MNTSVARERFIAHGQGNSANTNSNFSGDLGLALSIAPELWGDYHNGRSGAYLGRTFEGFPVCQLLI